jgi:hypothetical protein
VEAGYIRVVVKRVEKLAKLLAVVSFLTLCWVAHRSLQTRTQCVNSTFITFVQIQSTRIENCKYESRLNLSQLLSPLPKETLDLLRALEVLEPLAGVFPLQRPVVAVDIDVENPRNFELGHGYVRLGRDWLTDQLQTRRALIMGVLKRQHPEAYPSAFQLETMADFLLMSAMGEREWNSHSVLTEIKFPLSPTSFAEYCNSPFRSLAHYASCSTEDPDSIDTQAEVWGFRPLLATALWRVFEHASLSAKLRTFKAIRFGAVLPMVANLPDTNMQTRVQWFEAALQEHLQALHLVRSASEWSIKRVLKELDVDSPTHWELTVDITATPAWKEILEQFREWSHFHENQRTLVLTPEGEVALPSGLQVAWGKGEIQSQKHVMIACQWPKAADVVSVNARHTYMRQFCGKVDQVFWN